MRKGQPPWGFGGIDYGLGGPGRKLQCLTCNTVIQSQHRHDFVECKCEDPKLSVAIDGGDSYTRVLFGEGSLYRWINDEDLPAPEVGASSEINTPVDVDVAMPKV